METWHKFGEVDVVISDQKVEIRVPGLEPHTVSFENVNIFQVADHINDHKLGKLFHSYFDANADPCIRESHEILARCTRKSHTFVINWFFRNRVCPSMGLCDSIAEKILEKFPEDRPWTMPFDHVEALLKKALWAREIMDLTPLSLELKVLLDVVGDVLNPNNYENVDLWNQMEDAYHHEKVQELRSR